MTLFGRFWAAATLSSVGTAVTAVALPVLVVRDLQASAAGVGAVNAAQFLPYAALGLLAGVYADRWQRRRLLVWSSLGRAVSLGAVPVLWAAGRLEVWSLVLLLLAFGGFSVFGFAATQSLLPSLVARPDLVRANARLDASDAAARTLGPVVGGGLVGLLGAPVALAVDAVSYVADALINATLRVEETPRVPEVRSRLRREMAEGLRWTYTHPTLAPLALSTHVWFVAHAAGSTVLVVLALRGIGLSALVFGILLALGGLAGLAGAVVAPWGGRRLGTGRANATRRCVNRTCGALGAVLGGVAATEFGTGEALLAVAVLGGVSPAIVALTGVRAITAPATRSTS
ncbi:MFS transporter [Nocardioides acrostichi]|uniref:MFS transporter n=1 Tax=Nocardioides acrostichi TaxID=2784339 RepID=A0A930UZI2_9ACTN|nr:MFS transporter [Nocardioides acrostichi]MBF4163768.1 MFS transporter [Nocardioides acrostichi]